MLKPYYWKLQFTFSNKTTLGRLKLYANDFSRDARVIPHFCIFFTFLALMVQIPKNVVSRIIGGPLLDQPDCEHGKLLKTRSNSR